MSYFSKFPRFFTNYGDRKNVIIKDFFRRVNIGKNFRDYSVFLLPYLVRSGETPEIVSTKFYKNPLYHWVILHVNNIIDPRKEWAMTDVQLNYHVYEKYDFEITVPDVTKYSVNDVVTSSNDGEFIVNKVTDSTIFLRSKKGPVNLATSDTLTNITKNEPQLSMLLVIDPTEYIHHYIDSTTNLVIDYDINNPNIVPITNFQYEEEMNERKRIITVLDPRYLDRFVRDFENLVNR